MNKSFITLISLLFGFSAMYSQTKEIQQKELYQKCISNKKYIKQNSIEDLKAYSSIQNMKEFLLINALEKMTLQIGGITEVVSSKKEQSEGKNSKAITEAAITKSSYIYSKHILVNVIHQLNTKLEVNNYEETFQTMIQLIFKEDTIRHSSNTFLSSNDQGYTNELTRGKNKNWYNDVINELKYNGMEFNFIEDKNKVELCISLKKDLIKK